MQVAHRRARGATPRTGSSAVKPGACGDDVPVQAADMEVVVDDEHAGSDRSSGSLLLDGRVGAVMTPGRRAQKTAPLPSWPPASASQTSPPQPRGHFTDQRQADASTVHRVRIDVRRADRPGTGLRRRRRRGPSRRRSSRACRRHRAVRRHPARLVPAHRRGDGVVDEVRQHGRDVLRLRPRRHARASRRSRSGRTPRSPACSAFDSEQRLPGTARRGRSPTGRSIGARDASRTSSRIVARVGHATGIDQAGRHVQAVRELVSLHAQRIGHRRDRLEAIGERHDVGAVADHGDEAQIAIGARHRTGVDEDDVVADDERLGGIRSSAVRRRRATQRARAPARAGRDRRMPRPTEIGASRAFVRPWCSRPSRRRRTVGEHAVADAVEHRRLILHEGGELLRLQAESEPLEPSPEHERHHCAECDRAERPPARRLPSSRGSSSNTLAGANPTLTSPTGSSRIGSRTGTFARADSPSVPDSHADALAPRECFGEARAHHRDRAAAGRGARAGCRDRR